MPNIRIGERSLLTFKLESGWTKTNLYSKLMDEIASHLDSSHRKYGKYFLKIRGHYDKALLQNEVMCDACPYNPAYRCYHDYNTLRDEKEQILVLSSKYIDFREYDIYASYFTDKLDIEDSDNIELWAMNTGFFYYILKGIGIRR